MLDINHPESVPKLLEKIHYYRIDDSKPAEVKLWADRLLREHTTLVNRVTGDHSHQDFLLTYIRREKTKFQESADSRRNPYNERREKPLCTCGLECAIQKGHEPAEFSQHDDLDTAVRAFKRAHSGHPLVLDEAREAYYDELGRAKDLLRLLLVAFRHEVVPPEGERIAEMRESLMAEIDDDDGDADENDAEDESDETAAGVDEQIASVAEGD